MTVVVLRVGPASYFVGQLKVVPNFGTFHDVALWFVARNISSFTFSFPDFTFIFLIKLKLPPPPDSPANISKSLSLKLTIVLKLNFYSNFV